MASHKQKLEDAAIVLAEARAALKQAQSTFDELYKQAISGVKSRRGKSGAVIALPDAAKPSIEATGTDKIETVLLEDRNKQYTYKEIADRVGLPVPSVKALLYRLKKDGKTVRVGRGLWQATQPRLTNVP